MPSNELTLCTAAGITLLHCVKCQHHYEPVCVYVSVCVSANMFFDKTVSSLNNRRQRYQILYVYSATFNIHSRIQFEKLEFE